MRSYACLLVNSVETLAVTSTFWHANEFTSCAFHRIKYTYCYSPGVRAESLDWTTRPWNNYLIWKSYLAYTHPTRRGLPSPSWSIMNLPFVLVLHSMGRWALCINMCQTWNPKGFRVIMKRWWQLSNLDLLHAICSGPFWETLWMDGQGICFDL